MSFYKISNLIIILIFSVLSSGCIYLVTEDNNNNNNLKSSRDFKNNKNKLMDNTIFEAISSKKFNDLIINKNPEDVILDIRTLGEYDSGHLKNAKLLDFYSLDFAFNLRQLDKNITYFMYCRSGNRSNNALKLMKKLGFKKVYDLDHGINEWQAEGFEVVLE